MQGNPEARSKPWLMTIAILCSMTSVVHASMEHQTLDAASRSAIEDIYGDSQVEPFFLVDIGLRKVVTAAFRVFAPVRLGNDPAAASVWAMDEYRSFFKGFSLDDLSLPIVTGAPGNMVKTIHLQEHQGLRVFGAGVTVAMVDMGDRMDVIEIKNRSVAGIDLDVDYILRTGVSLDDALQSIASYEIYGAPFGYHDVIETEQEIFFADETDSPTSLAQRARVAYRIAASGNLGKFLFWIDVESGEVIKHLDYVLHYGREVEVSEGHGSENYDSDWTLAYTNSSTIPTTFFWLFSANYHPPYNSYWFDVDPNKAALRDVPMHYHWLLEQNGHNGIKSGSEAFGVHLGYDSIVDYGACCYGDTGYLLFHEDWSVPDVVGHEMTHWFLLLKDSPYYHVNDIIWSVHEGMSDIFGEIVAFNGYGEDDWISGTGVPNWQFTTKRDHSQDPSTLECHGWDGPMAAANTNSVDDAECRDVFCSFNAANYLQICEMGWIDTPYNPAKHDICVGRRMHTFPCPYHIDYDADTHNEDLVPGHDHVCFNVVTDLEFPCPVGLSHTYSGGGLSKRHFFECHNWGRILGRVGYLLWQSGIVDNNGVSVSGIGADKFERLILETAFAFEQAVTSGFVITTMFESGWSGGDFTYDDSVPSPVLVTAPPDEWENKWSEVCETMWMTCRDLNEEGTVGFGWEECSSVAKAWVSVGACDFDDDGVANMIDNCEWVYNPGQTNSDSSINTFCVIDMVSGEVDCWPELVGDEFGDACDACPTVVGADEGCPEWSMAHETLRWPPEYEIVNPPLRIINDNRWMAAGTTDGLIIVAKSVRGNVISAELLPGRAVKEMFAIGEYLLASAGNDFVVMEMSDPANPTPVYELPMDAEIDFMFKSRSMIFVSVGNSVTSIIVEDPETPAVWGTYSAEEKIVDIDETDGLLLVGTPSKLSLIDTANGLNEISTMSFDTLEALEISFGYVVVKTSTGISIVDIEDAYSPTIVSSTALNMPGWEIEAKSGRIMLVFDPRDDFNEHCRQNSRLLVGDTGANTLLGSDEDECIHGMGGTDLIIAGDGDDTILFGPGGGTGFGGPGDDIINGSGDMDVLAGGPGADQIMPHGGLDFVFADGGDDIIHIFDQCELPPGKFISGGFGQDKIVSPMGSGFTAFWNLLMNGVFVVGIEEFEMAYDDDEGAEKKICYQ